MPKGEHEAPDRIWIDPVERQQRWHRSPRNNAETPFLRTTPARLAAPQMLAALKALNEAASAYAAAVARGGDVTLYRARLEARYDEARAAITAAEGKAE